MPDATRTAKSAAVMREGIKAALAALEPDPDWLFPRQALASREMTPRKKAAIMIPTNQRPDDFLLDMAQYAEEANEYIHQNHEALLRFAPVSDTEEATGPVVAVTRALLAVALALLDCIPKTHQH